MVGMGWERVGVLIVSPFTGSLPIHAVASKLTFAFATSA